MKYQYLRSNFYFAHAFLILAFLALLGSTSHLEPSKTSPYNVGRMEDSLEMVRFYNALNGSIWLESWNLNQSMDTWWGVFISSTGRVQSIILRENRVFGTVPADLNLPFLADLQLQRNELIGPVPDFQNLPSMVHLELSYNKLTGSIPDFSNMPDLTFLDVSSNQLTGELLDFTKLPKLLKLFVSGNQLTGPIPDFSNLPLLQGLDVRFSKHSGTVPDFSNIPNLKTLGIGGENLSGSIPDFSNLPVLEWLSIEGTPLGGAIPNFSKLLNLEELFLTNNKLEGLIPDFSSMPKLRILNLSGNQLEGPALDFTNLPKLNDYNLSGNRLSGPLPDFANLPALVRLSIAENQLTGSLPDFFRLKNLEELELSRNLLSGQVPDFSELGRLSALRLNQNLFSDSIPDFSKLPRLQVLGLGSNKFEFCPRFTHAPLLEVLGIDNNRLTFEDVLANIDQVDDYFYFPQAEVAYPCPFVRTAAGSDLGIQLYIDAAIGTNVYQWLKDEEPYLSIPGLNRLDFYNIKAEDGGLYRCQITNPNAPELVLEVEGIALAVDSGFGSTPTVLSAEPAQPDLDQPVTIFYDITTGDAGLANCNCDIYVHTGVLTNESANLKDWKHVTTIWGSDNPAWRMTPVSGQPNLYSFVISPSIREYYSIEPDEMVEQMAFVFRNAAGTIGGKAANGDDLFYPLVPPPSESAPLNLKIGDAAGSFGEQVCFNMLAQSPTAIGSLELSMQWDTSVLAFSGLQNLTLAGLSPNDFNVSSTADGSLAVSWESDSQPSGISFPEETSLFQACFRSKADSCSNSLLTFSDVPQQPGARSAEGECLFLESYPGIFSSACEQALQIPAETGYLANSEYTNADGWTDYIKASDLESDIDTILLSVQKNGSEIGSVGDGIFKVNINKFPGTTEATDFIRQFNGFEEVEAAHMLNYFWGLSPNYTALSPGGPFGLRYYFGPEDLGTLAAALGTEITTADIVFFKAPGLLPNSGSPDFSTLATDAVQLYTLATGPSGTKWAVDDFGAEDLSATMLVENFSFGGMIVVQGKVTKVQEVAGLANLSVMPNPSHGLLRLFFRADAREILELRLVNALGEIGHRQTLAIYPGENSQTLQLQKLAGGVYFLQLRNGKGQVSTRRFVIVK